MLKHYLEEPAWDPSQGRVHWSDTQEVSPLVLAVSYIDPCINTQHKHIHFVDVGIVGTKTGNADYSGSPKGKGFALVERPEVNSHWSAELRV